MKRVLLAVALVLSMGVGIALAGGAAPAAEREVAKPGVVVADVLEVKALLEAIDYKKRTVTLKGAQGRTITLKADKAVKNFEQLKKSEPVLVEFVESAAISIRKANARPGAAEVRLVSVAPKGANRAVLLAETFQLTAIVEAIDYKGRLLTVKEPNRSIRIIPVDKSIKQLESIKKGEEVVLRVTEPIAIKIEKRK
jgi:hypothetical protein